MSHCKIHNIRFYNPEPRGIHHMALNKSSKKLAISRVDASIEIWNLSSTWFLESTIPFSNENFSIEGLAWLGTQLFSVGLHGLLIEYNLKKLAIENRLVVTGEAAFCLDVDRKNSMIAVGTEQGYINIFKVNEGEVLFDRFFDKQEDRILCLKFNVTSEFVVSGSTDSIRVWNIASGHAIHKMSVGRSESNKPTIVWCLDVTSDFTIISGDSRGKLCFWDGKIGSQTESYQSHKADILALCLSEDENSLFCAGVDPNIIFYQRIIVRVNSQKWIKSIQRKIHDHDVHALALCDNRLYSGGADSYLSCSFHPPKTLLKLPPLLPNPCVCVSSEARYLMLRYPKYLEVWSLGRAESVENNYKGLVNLTEEPKKLLTLQRVSKDYDSDEEKEGIICSCMSNDGKWIFYSTSLGIRLFQFSYENDKARLMKIQALDGQSVPCVQAVFTHDSNYLVTAPNDGGITIYELQVEKVTVKFTLESKGITGPITHLLVSSCGKYIIAGDPNSNIMIWTMKNKQWTNYCKLPKYNFPPTAMVVHPTLLNLVIVYSDGKLLEYDIKKRHLTQFSKQFENTEWKSRVYPIINITFDPRADHIIILHDDTSIIIVDKEKKSAETKMKVAKLNSSNGIEDKTTGEFAFYSFKKYKHLVHLSWLADDEMVAVEVSPLSLLEKLPPAFLQSTFGQK